MSYRHLALKPYTDIAPHRVRSGRRLFHAATCQQPLRHQQRAQLIAQSLSLTAARLLRAPLPCGCVRVRLPALPGALKGPPFPARALVSARTASALCPSRPCNHTRRVWRTVPRDFSRLGKISPYTDLLGGRDCHFGKMAPSLARTGLRAPACMSQWERGVQYSVLPSGSAPHPSVPIPAPSILHGSGSRSSKSPTRAKHCFGIPLLPEASSNFSTQSYALYSVILQFLDLCSTQSAS